MNFFRRRLFGLVTLAACLLTGCVERRFVITTTAPGFPPEKDLGATILDETGQALGGSPADKSFVYYGKYRFTAIKDGYQTTIHEEYVQPPWYERFPFDFVAENMIPWTLRDVRRVSITMQPMAIVPPENILQQGAVLRERGKTIGQPPP